MILFYSIVFVIIGNGLVIGEISINDEVLAGQLITDLSTNIVFSQYLIKDKSLFRLISTGSFMTYLKLESETGQLFANKKIDRDFLCNEIEICCINEKVCVIPISVAMITKSKISIEPFTQQIQIYIYDINDNKPKFKHTSYNLSIAESCPLSTTFLLPLAVDQDSTDYSIKSYRLTSKEYDDVFDLDTQLVDNKLAVYLRLRQMLDREQIDKYSLKVIAFDGGEPSLTGTLDVVITVADVNDNSPIFENSQYKILVKESQISRDHILQVHATDKDIRENSEIFYKFDSGLSSIGSLDLFRIDIHSGYLFLIAHLDYEKQQSHKLIILAANRELGLSTATATVVISVVNINDEKPSIIIDNLSNNQHALIYENIPAPLFVAIISVTDKDKGISGKVLCNLNNYQEIFDLRQSSQDQFKVYSKQQFDRESIAKYSVVVICHDQGIPSLTSEANLSIHILDENDNSPEIKSPSIFRIRENKPKATIVTTIIATDKDDGLNGKLYFTISDKNNIIFNFIRIDYQTGTILTTEVIDKESRNPPLSSIDFILTVTDEGTPKLTTSMSMQLIIQDENDNEPHFSQKVFRFTIAENEPTSFRLGQIEVTDLDEVGSLRLSLNYNRKIYRNCPFSIIKEKDLYWLTTNKPLDWEEDTFHELIVIATDGQGYNSHTSSSTIIVNVLDVNDHKPLFIFPRPGNNSWNLVSYLNKAGFVLMTVSASDKDNPVTNNGKFHFSITSNSDNLFNIDPNLGKLRIQRQMISSDIGNHCLLIKVEDLGSPPLLSEMKINIRVTDQATSFNEKYSKTDNNLNYNESERSFFTENEVLLVFSLVVILLFLIFSICFILYIRHIKGWLSFLPDIIELCHSNERNQIRKDCLFKPHQVDINNLKKLNSPTQTFMDSFPPSYCHNSEPLIMNNKECYDALKIRLNTSPMKRIHYQSYNDLRSVTMIPQYHSNYLTLHQYPPDCPNINYNIKPLQSSQWNINNVSEKEANSYIESKNSQNTYAVSFPTEESTFV